MGMKRLSCVFYVNVVSVKYLPVTMERLLLTVRVADIGGDTVFAKPSRVFNGAADFNETLALKCSIHCNQDGKNGVEFEKKLLVIDFISVYRDLFGGESDYIGQHHVDLGDIIKKSVKGNNSANEYFGFSGMGTGGAFHLKFGYKITATPTKEGRFDWLFKRNRDYVRIPSFSEKEMSSLGAIDQEADVGRKITLEEMIAEENARPRTDVEDGLDWARFYAAQDLAVYKDVTIWGELKNINGYSVNYKEVSLALKMDEHCIGLVLQGPIISTPENPDNNDYEIYISKTETEYSKHVSNFPIVLLRDTSKTFDAYINSKKVPKNESVQVDHGSYISLHSPADQVDTVARGFVYLNVASWEREGRVDPFKELSNKLDKMMAELRNIGDTSKEQTLNTSTRRKGEHFY